MSEHLTAEFLASVLDMVADPVFVKDREYNFVLVNDEFCKLVAQTREALIGKTDYDFFPKEQADFFRKKDEEMFVREATVDIAEEPISTADGEDHILRTRKVPLRNDEGEVTHIVGIINDITTIKKAEATLRDANELLEKRVADRTTELQRFAYSAFHELNGPTLGMIRLSEWLLEDHADTLDDDAREKVRMLNDRAHRLQQMVSDLSAYTRAGAKREPDLLDMLELTNECWRELAVPSGFTLERDEPFDDIRADRGTMMHVLGNLIGNAVRHHDQREGKVTVSCREDGDAVALTVADDGPGIAPAYQERVFNLFYRLRTRDEVEGTGVGLPLVRRIVSAVGGTVDLASKVGEGTLVTVRWPR